MKDIKILSSPFLTAILVFCLLFASLAIAMEARPIEATAGSITINWPASDNVVYVQPGDGVDVNYTLNGGATTTDLAIFITDPTLGTAGSSGTLTKNDDATYTTTVFTSPTALEGTYKVQITATGVTTAESLDSVVVDDTAPTVSLLQPNSSGLCYQAGSALPLQWTASDSGNTENVTIEAQLSSNGGGDWGYTVLVATSYPQGPQTYSGYNLPAVDSTICKVRIRATDVAGNTSAWVTSANNFSILNTAPTVGVTYPSDSGIVLNGGSSTTITFTTSSASSTLSYWIKLWQGTTPTDITTSWLTSQPTGDRTYAWTVNNNVRGSNFKIQVTARDCANNTSSDNGTSAFRIKDVTAPTVTITAPPTGGTLYAGSANNISWTATDNCAGNLTTTLWYSTDGGVNYNLITTNTYAQGAQTYSWSIPAGISSSNCKIKITASDGESPTNTGTGYSGVFTISSDTTPPTVTLCTPNGGESWQAGTVHSITWTASDSPSTEARLIYTIALSTDGGSTYPTTVATLTNQVQCASCSCTYSWSVPDNATSTAKIRITAEDPAGNTSSDVSDAVFTITAPECAIQTETVILYDGWNLVSLPIIPISTNIDNILSGIMPDVISVWYYTGGASGSWISYAPGAPNLLTTMEPGKAYWIKMDTTAVTYNWDIQGRACPCAGSGENPPTFTISNTGWHMIGFKSTVDKQVQNYLSSMGTCGTAYYTPVEGYNADTGVWLDKYCTDNMTTGSGYWIYFTTTGTIVPGCD